MEDEATGMRTVREEKIKSQKRERESEKRESLENISNRAKVETSPNTVCFPVFCDSRGSNSTLRDQKLHAVVARSTLGTQDGRSKLLSVGVLLEVQSFNKCTRLWREARLEVNMLRAPHVRTTFGRCNMIFSPPAR